ncbi:MAG TPA: hypothetical protein VGB70_01800 [Allosphingosinicella sp.]
MLAKSVRSAALNVLRALLQRKIVDVVGLAALYSAGCVWVLWKVGLWGLSNLKTVVLWFITTAFVAMANTKDLESGPAMFPSLIREALAITSVVVFISGINTLPLWAELLMLPFLMLLAAMVAVAEHRPEHKIVLGPLNTMLAISGLYILGYSAYRILTDWQKLDPAFQAREFAVPIALTVMFLPYLYGLMIYMGFENAAIRLRFKIQDSALRRSIWWRGALAFGLHPRAFARFIKAVQMSDVSDSAGVAKLVATLRGARQRERTRPAVDWSEGWSPYEAGAFLKAHGLVTNPYHPLLVNWAAESPYLKLSTEVLTDTMVYRTEGTETAVTELELELDARWSDLLSNSDERFWTAAVALVTKALGDEAAERFAHAIPTDVRVAMTAGSVTIRLMRDDWSVGERNGYSRRLTIRHPAYRDPFVSS